MRLRGRALFLLVATMGGAACHEHAPGIAPFATLSGLQDPLVMKDGTRVTNAAMWTEKRRPEILRLFETHVYGKTPQRKLPVRFVQTEEGPALDGAALRRQVSIYFSDADLPRMDLLIYIPTAAKRIDGRSPVFLGLNFCGNHTVDADPAIHLAHVYPQPHRGCVPPDGDLSAARGLSATRWPVAAIIKRGYALATAYYYDLDPDFDDFSNGVHPLFFVSGQTQRAEDDWGAIGAWAWGLSRAIDYFETDNSLDPKSVAVVGHSRLGKTALWAGAQDARIAMAISNDSGMFGAALTRRQPWNATHHIEVRKYWFALTLQSYRTHALDLPVDQHLLVALMAPRPVYVASGSEDDHADPPGEFLSALHADPVYRLLGMPGLPDEWHTRWPGIEEAQTTGTIGHHVRLGDHDITPYDWQRYMDFADRQLK